MLERGGVLSLRIADDDICVAGFSIGLGKHGRLA